MKIDGIETLGDSIVLPSTPIPAICSFKFAAARDPDSSLVVFTQAGNNGEFLAAYLLDSFYDCPLARANLYPTSCPQPYKVLSRLEDFVDVIPPVGKWMFPVGPTTSVMIVER
jgi:hypothetical protein